MTENNITTIEQPPKVDEAEEFSRLMDAEHKDVRREKMDLSSVRRVLDRLKKEGTITEEDKLTDILKIIDEELARIEERLGSLE